MKITKRILLAAVVVITCACQKTKESQVTVVSDKKEQTASEIHRLPLYDHSDTVRMGSHLYAFAIHREACDSLPLVTDENGSRYADNLYTLRITRSGQAFFKRTFTKAQFASKLTSDFRAKGILDGFRFVNAREGLLRFAVCVSYPESDMSAPFLLTIGGDGSYTITPDDVMDVEEESGEDGV